MLGWKLTGVGEVGFAIVVKGGCCACRRGCGVYVACLGTGPLEPSMPH